MVLMLSGSGGHVLETLEELPAGIGQYDDFHTIDWVRDLARDRLRHRIIKSRQQPGYWGTIKMSMEASAGWVCVLLIGCLAGVYHCLTTVYQPYSIN
jgi:chloride channel 3/4/5